MILANNSFLLLLLGFFIELTEVDRLGLKAFSSETELSIYY